MPTLAATLGTFVLTATLAPGHAHAIEPKPTEATARAPGESTDAHEEQLRDETLIPPPPGWKGTGLILVGVALFAEAIVLERMANRHFLATCGPVLDMNGESGQAQDDGNLTIEVLGGCALGRAGTGLRRTLSLVTAIGAVGFVSAGAGRRGRYDAWNRAYGADESDDAPRALLGIGLGLSLASLPFVAIAQANLGTAHRTCLDSGCISDQQIRQTLISDLAAGVFFVGAAMFSHGAAHQIRYKRHQRQQRRARRTTRRTSNAQALRTQLLRRARTLRIGTSTGYWGSSISGRF